MVSINFGYSIKTTTNQVDIIMARALLYIRTNKYVRFGLKLSRNRIAWNDTDKGDRLLPTDLRTRPSKASDSLVQL